LLQASRQQLQKVKMKMKQILFFYFFWIGILTLTAQLVNAQTTKGVTPVQNKSNSIIGNTWAVVVGISDYQNPDIPDLQYAHRDAAAFVQYLKSPAGGRVEDSHIQSLLNEQATAGRFASALDWLMEKAKENDQAIIYFSGHGDVERKTITQPGFLLCWDAPAKVYMGGGTFGLIYLQEIISTLSLQTKAKVIVITDACRSGKLAGSEIGGAHATAANLAKQYANEIKIMSCQPDELSLEGPEWGGGRGVFSFFFLNGITGYADLNKDGSVSLFEIDRFLGDKIPEATSPRMQIPMTIGNKGIAISSVDQASFLALQKNENLYSDQILALNEKSEKKTDAFASGNTDPILLEKYNKFKKALKEGHLIYPEENSAWSLYQQLKDKAFIASELASIQSNLAAALQDEAQQAINDYLKADPKELKNRWSYDDKYERFPVYLSKAAELLGESHYLYKSIKAREHYFSGLNMRLNGERKKDTTLYRLAIIEQNKAITLDSSAAYAYNELGLLARRFKYYQASINYFNQAILQSPRWVYPWANLTNSYSKLGNNELAIESGLKSIDIDPHSILSQFNLGKAYEFNSNWKEAIEHYLKVLELDSKDKETLFDLGFMFYKEKDYLKAEEVTIKYKTLYPEDVNVYIPFICIYVKMGSEDKAFDVLEMAFKNGYNDFKAIETEPDLKDFISSPRYLALRNKYFN
jgi:uncharacterized caspase-like protein/lipoprotein NlpI